MPLPENSALARALVLSQAMFDAAERAELSGLAALDAERLQLLKSFKLDNKAVGAQERLLLQRIAQLNDRAIGVIEHHKRSKGRDMDMAAVGRRAVAAYSNTRPR